MRTKSPLAMVSPLPSATVGLAASAGAGLLNLWFKGAAAAFYLRRVEVGNEGAAFARSRAPER